MREETERNAEIWALYQSGMTQVDIAERYGIVQGVVSGIIARERVRMGLGRRTEMIADFVAEVQRNRTHLIAIRDADAPPAFSVKGDMLIDENGQPVRDVAPRLAATRELANQQAHAAKLLGLNAPDRVQQDTTVHFTIEGVDEDVFT